MRGLRLRGLHPWGLRLEGLLDYEVEIIELGARACGIGVVSADERQEECAGEYHCYAERAAGPKLAQPDSARSARVCGLIQLVVNSHARGTANLGESYRINKILANRILARIIVIIAHA